MAFFWCDIFLLPWVVWTKKVYMVCKLCQVWLLWSWSAMIWVRFGFSYDDLSQVCILIWWSKSGLLFTVIIWVMFGCRNFKTMSSVFFIQMQRMTWHQEFPRFYMYVAQCCTLLLSYFVAEILKVTHIIFDTIWGLIEFPEKYWFGKQNSIYIVQYIRYTYIRWYVMMMLWNIYKTSPV